MIRVVDFTKAVTAGIAGAAAMEVVLRGFALIGLPVFDLVAELGGVIARQSPALQWGIGLGAHAFVGIMWALFYAYFFWSRLKLPPPLQGLVFAVVPALLALFIVHPQLTLMQMNQDVVQVSMQLLLGTIGIREISGILISHAVISTRKHLKNWASRSRRAV